MRLKELGESIITQCLDDLWDPMHRKESIDFFSGDGFRTCATLAGIGLPEQVKLLMTVADMVMASGRLSAGAAGDHRTHSLPN